VTRIYFPDEAAANAADPVLSGLEESRRATLLAVAEPQDPGAGGGPRRFCFDICLQDQPGGAPETVFFDV
jgi:protocatechuate 3,4-dioxygenase alpha subunit